MATGVEPRCPTCGAYVQGIINLPPCPSCSEKDREIERLRACVHSPQGLEKRGIAACMKLIATLRAERDKYREALHNLERAKFAHFEQGGCEAGCEYRETGDADDCDCTGGAHRAAMTAARCLPLPEVE